MAKRTALDGAAAKGWDAYHAGKAESQNPYPDRRGGRRGNMLTWSRAFRTAWQSGWRIASYGEPRP